MVLQSVHWMAALLELEKDEALVLQSAWGMAALLAWMWVRMWDAVSEEQNFHGVWLLQIFLLSDSILALGWKQCSIFSHLCLLHHKFLPDLS